MIDLGIVVAYFAIIFVIGLRARADAGVARFGAGLLASLVLTHILLH